MSAGVRGVVEIVRKRLESQTILLKKGLNKQTKESRIHGFAKSGDQEGTVQTEESELIRKRQMKAGTPIRKFSYKSPDLQKAAMEMQSMQHT